MYLPDMCLIGQNILKLPLCLVIYFLVFFWIFFLIGRMYHFGKLINFLTIILIISISITLKSLSNIFFLIVLITS